jgi:prevent-host-death family protein
VHSYLVSLTKSSPMSHFVTLYEAKTHLSGLVDRAAAGEEIVIAKNGVPQARLVPLASRGGRRQPANAMRIRHIAADFDAPDPAIEALFGGEEK